jgi:hypothetical protein
MATKVEIEIRELLLMTGCLQPLKIEQKGGHLSVLCREIKGMASLWLKKVDLLLKLGEEGDVPFHLCRKYVLKNGQMVFGWHVGIDAKSVADLHRCLAVLRAAMENADSQEAEEEPAVEQPSAGQHQQTKQYSDEEKKQRNANYKNHTQSAPRTPENDQADPIPPANFEFGLKLIESGQMMGKNGRMEPKETYEVPLPHVYIEDRNVPNKKGRGAIGTPY